MCIEISTVTTNVHILGRQLRNCFHFCNCIKTDHLFATSITQFYSYDVKCTTSIQVQKGPSNNISYCTLDIIGSVWIVPLSILLLVVVFRVRLSLDRNQKFAPTDFFMPAYICNCKCFHFNIHWHNWKFVRQSTERLLSFLSTYLWVKYTELFNNKSKKKMGWEAMLTSHLCRSY